MFTGKQIRKKFTVPETAKHELVIVRWVDAFGPRSEWSGKKKAADVELAACEMIGWIIRDDKHRLTLYAQRSVDEDGSIDYSGEMPIPAGSVIEIKKLKEFKR